MAPNIEFNTSTLTTNAGTPVANNRFTLRAGPRGELFLCVLTVFAHLAQAYVKLRTDQLFLQVLRYSPTMVRMPHEPFLMCHFLCVCIICKGLH